MLCFEQLTVMACNLQVCGLHGLHFASFAQLGGSHFARGLHFASLGVALCKLVATWRLALCKHSSMAHPFRVCTCQIMPSLSLCSIQQHLNMCLIFSIMPKARHTIDVAITYLKCNKCNERKVGLCKPQTWTDLSQEELGPTLLHNAQSQEGESK